MILDINKGLLTISAGGLRDFPYEGWCGGGQTRSTGKSPVVLKMLSINR